MCIRLWRLDEISSNGGKALEHLDIVLNALCLLCQAEIGVQEVAYGALLRREDSRNHLYGFCCIFGVVLGGDAAGLVGTSRRGE